jgi:small-conductance mechanosensitive channel
MTSANQIDVGGLLSWLRSLAAPTTLVELAVIAGCLALSAGLVRLARGAEPRPGIWFGQRIVDGVLFPTLALGAVLIARGVLHGIAGQGAFRIAVPVLTSLVAIRIGVRVLHTAFPQSRLVMVAERSISWVAWGAVVLWVTGLMPLLIAALDGIRWKMGGAEVSVWSLVEGTATAGVVLLLALWISSALEARLLAGVPGVGADLSLRKIAANATRALLVFVGLLLAMSAAGIPLGALGVLGGAIGVGIGFGLQKLAANYVSGFVILAERSLRIGDMVRVDAFEGRITDIHTRYTVIRALNGRESIVPNELLITQRVESATLSDPNVVLRTTVQVAYGTDLDVLIPRLRDAVASVPRVLTEPGPGVLLNAFAADGLELLVGFWIADPQNGEANVRSEVNRTILRTLVEHGVEIPFPQRVVRQHVA